MLTEHKFLKKLLLRLKPNEKDSKEAKRKGKEVLIESEKPMKRKAQLQIDEELARKLQEEEEVPLAKLNKEKTQL